MISHILYILHTKLIFERDIIQFEFAHSEH